MDARASNSAGPSPNTASVRHAGPVVGLRIVLVILAGTASWPGFAATNAIVADLITEERRESAYAAMRVAPTSALSPGPARWPLLIGTHWPRPLRRRRACRSRLGSRRARLTPAQPPFDGGVAGQAEIDAARAFRAILGDRASFSHRCGKVARCGRSCPPKARGRLADQAAAEADGYCMRS
jgi:hypothetical protein